MSFIPRALRWDAGSRRGIRLLPTVMLAVSWREKVTAEFVTHTLWEIRGDDMRTERRQLSRHDLHTI